MSLSKEERRIVDEYGNTTSTWARIGITAELEPGDLPEHCIALLKEEIQPQVDAWLLQQGGHIAPPQPTEREVYKEMLEEIFGGEAIITEVVTIMAVNVPVIVITHIYKASEQDVEKKRERDSISETEEARWKLAFNIKLETFKDEKGYGVIVRECRERPGMKPFIIRDKPGGMFRAMPERIMKALYEAEQPADEPKGWADFGVKKPFPDTGEQFKQNAVREMVNYFVEVDDQKFYAFGDPNETPTKKNGDPGVNGAHSHALNAYARVAKEYKAKGGKNLGELTQRLKDYTEEKVKAQVNAYLDGKIAAQAEQGLEVPPEAKRVEGLVEGQPGLGLEVEEPAPKGGGAAYAN